MAKDERRGGSIHEIHELFDALGERANFDLLDPDSSEKFTAEIKRLFDEGRQQPHFDFGKRVEAMFEFVAASLGKCQLIKKEDSGGFATNHKQKLQPPDYAIVTEDGRQVLIEVKNHHDSPPKTWSVRVSDLRALRRYAKLTGRPLYFAVFWSGPRVWTLIPANMLCEAGGRASIEFGEAFKANHMSVILGDLMIGTTPPLTFRAICDLSKTRKIRPDGLADFTVGAVELWCAGKKLEDPFEQKLAWMFMLYSDWVSADWEAIIENGELIAAELSCEPQEPVDKQNFQIVGSLSSLISRQYDALTIRDGKVARHKAEGSPDQLGVIIPADYKGKALPVWRFHQQPTGEVHEV